MARETIEQLTPSKAHSVFVRLVLPPYTIHFKAPKYMKESTLELLDKKVCKATLVSTAHKATVREAIGTDPKFWSELVGVLRVGVVSLERRSFAVWDPTGVDYESTSGALIAGHYPGLWKDLERVNDLLSIARNVLTVGAPAQDLAAAYSVESEVFKLINCAVRVTARGYDGEAGVGVAGGMSDEEKWQYIVNAYKKLLITSLQFLNNLVAQNEKRKLALWMNLFDCGSASDTVLADGDEDGRDVLGLRESGVIDIPSNPTHEPVPPVTGYDQFVAYGREEERVPDAAPFYERHGFLLFAKRNRQVCAQEYGQAFECDPSDEDIRHAVFTRWDTLDPLIKAQWRRSSEDLWEKYYADMKVYEAKAALHTQREIRSTDFTPPKPTNKADEDEADDDAYATRYRPINAEDLKMHFTADAGIRILESGKSELMKRLEGYEPPHASQGMTAYGSDPTLSTTRHLDAARPMRPRSTHPVERTRTLSRTPSPQAMPPPPADHRVERDSSLPPLPQVGGPPGRPVSSNDPDSSEEEGDHLEGENGVPPSRSEGEEEEEEEEDDPEAEEEEGSNEDGRGLLTDVPLILGPSEIEVLPMIIMSGIVAPAGPSPNQQYLANTHTVRTHLLLAQDNGRNLLRELLIFVAAWDLREEELYFKFMVKIMEAVLAAGLMPFAYHAFRDRSRSRDIISPAQAVIMKLLTNIFRARSEASKAAERERAEGNPTADEILRVPRRADLQILHFIFTEFRQHIIPQTCALIFLQGQIHRSRALPSDFPLNLWDMERMYEGVYGVLEFFAVVCEEGWGKEVLAGWEASSELVTLIRELEGGIPKLGVQNGFGNAFPGAAEGLRRRVSAPAGTGLPLRASSADARVPSQHSSTLQPPADRLYDFETSDADLGTRLPPLPLPVPPPVPNQNLPPPPSQLQTQSLAPDQQTQIFEPTTPLAYPDSATGAAEADEPSDFEWRNLKKLTVLVLSSLIWKNPSVQEQVRRHGGLEALVGCCRMDEHNPYIREHAIMCLRFAVEGCKENRAVLERLSGQQRRGRQVLSGGSVTLGGGVGGEEVPREVLDTNGYETFMDGKGQVGLRRKESVVPSSSSSSSTNANHASSSTQPASQQPQAQKPRLPPPTKLTAEKAAELMQNALRDLPLGDKLVTDRQKAEALAKLDRAFESTERVLGGAMRR